MNIGIDDICFHDSRIHRIVETPELDELAFEVMYPVDWEKNMFSEHTIVFTDVLDYAVAEGPFCGSPTILCVVEIGDFKDRTSLRIETNAGDRTLLCKSVHVSAGWGNPTR